MAVRGLTELQTLLADNTIGNIGADDLRDMLDSLWPGRISEWVANGGYQARDLVYVNDGIYVA